MFDNTKTRFLLLGVAVVGLGVILGTALWLKLAPLSRLAVEQNDSSNGVKQYGSVPEFTLTERDGSVVSLQQLRGKIWVADFIYTSCTDTCPLQSAMMAKLQQQYATNPDFQLVSFTVDPQRDTPQALTSYATKFQADGKRWYFLTGQRERILRLVEEGFHLAVATFSNDTDSAGVIGHSPRFVLIDKDAQIRGYYDIRESEAFVRLKDDIDSLVKG
ncbi:MAG TPA: SCO family protein [Candidatus Binatia bacterium]|jgi:protein SCO1/2|nr:SCO family protein [Candidatus Binatia bacterium]